MCCSQSSFSLLWTDKSSKTENSYIGEENTGIINDLDLDRIASEMSIDRYHKVSTEMLLSYISNNCTDIRYRLDVVEDLVNNPEFAEELKMVVPSLDELISIRKRDQYEEFNFFTAVKRISELSVFVHFILGLNNLLSRYKNNLKSEGMKRLLCLINDISNDESFLSLQEELPKLQIGLRKINSVTIGINLDEMFYPKEAILVSLNEQVYRERSLFAKITGKQPEEGDFTGITPFYKFYKDKEGNMIDVERKYEIFAKALYSNLDDLLKSVIKPLIPITNKYINTNTEVITDLLPEFCYLLGAAKLIGKLQSCGLPLCKPEVEDMEKRVCVVEDSYNIILALNMYDKYDGKDLKDIIVLNDIRFDDKGRIAVVTGPNQGGKTTYIQSIGIAQAFFQLGLFIPGKRAQISPVDRIFTHFPVEESFSSNMGRMAEECNRLKQIIRQATRFSMIMLNESFSSTSSTEALFITREVLFGLKILGTRAILATHIHEIASNLDVINSSIPGDSIIISLVSRAEEEKYGSGLARRTYRITQGSPVGLSYARDIALKYGISIDSIMETFHERNEVDNSVQAEDIKEVYKKLYVD